MSDAKFQITVGDRLPLLNMRLWDEGRDNSLTGCTVAFTMYDSTGTVKVNAASCTAEPGITFTADATTDRITANAHSLQDGWEVTVSSSGTLPTPLASTTRYFTRECTPNYCKLALEPTGPAIDITAAGSPTHTLRVLGQVQYAWASGDVDTAKTYKGYFVVTVTASGKTTRWPNTDQGIEIVVVGVPTP